MYPPASGAQSASARRQPLAIILSALLLLQFIPLGRPVRAITNSGSITSLGTPLTENFNTLATTGTGLTWTDNVTIPGWYTSRPTYNTDTGGSGTGALYSYGSTASTDRALGTVGSGTTGNILAGVRLVNNTGVTITSLDISFVGEQWRNGGSATTGVLSVAQTVDFQYQVANPGVVTDANVPATTGWVDYNPLDFTSPRFGTNAGAALDGNLAANRVPLASTLTVTVTPGQEIWLRWLDINHADNDHGMAIDDFSVTANGAGTPTPVPSPSPTPGALQFNAATYTVAETGGSASITVSRTGGSDGSVTVNYATSDGTATNGAGNDYTSASGTLTFANGETSKSFSVPVLDDANFEGDETVNLTLSGPTGGATLGAQGTAVLTITDNEVAPPVTPGSVVISQIYGGGGNSGALYQNDFIEIFNRSTSAVNLAGWSVQYSSAAGSSWSNRTNLSGTLAPGQYFLIKGGAGANGDGAPLPTPDIDGTINLSGSNGKVALVSSVTALTGTCPVGGTTVVDFVGYGGDANCFEGTAAAPELSTATAALRTRNGCKDTDFNNLNFTEVAPAPRNSFSPANACPAGDFAPEVFSTDPANGGVNYPVASNVIVNFDTAVTVSDGGFTLSCTNSGAHTLTVTGGPVTFTLNPDTDFAQGEQCTATVLASHVTSQATTPVPMVANYVWTFGTLIVRDPAEHMVMGNPSGAVTDEATPLNYLMLKPQYALSYNNDRGIPNWTSWHLDSTWTTGVADRQNDFRPDPTLPAGFKRVASGYQAAVYGFDRGHMTPSADRTSSEEDNSATFLMTNMVPQASGNNQGPWADMENDLRALLGGTSNELYIVSGGHGVGGNSTTGHWDTIQDTGGNTVTVPNLTWKVVMVMPRADGDDVARVNNATRTFAVIMPNNDNIRPDDWKKYLATVDQVEALTGYNFFSNVPEAIQNVIEARLDEEYDTAPVVSGQSVTTPEDTERAVTLSASDFNVNNVFTYTVVGGPSHGVLSGTGGELTYTPFADYNGPDSFTFKANDGAKDSNTATVSINVTSVNDVPTLADVPASANIPELAAYTFTATAGDADNDALTFSLVGAPAGAAISASGVFTWTPTEAQGGTGSPYSFNVRVSDGVANADSPVTLTVGEVNQAPTLGAIGSKVVLLGGTLTFTAVGADADLPAQGLSYSLTGSVPSGASIDQTSGVFTWTPTAAQAGQTHTFTVRVTDALGLSGEETISVGVGHNWSGVLQPINANGTSVFKLGRVVPIKFQLTGASAPVTNAVVRLYVAKVADSVVGTELEADSNSNATEGNLFRYADGQYMFNWNTSGLSAGTYQLRFDMGDGVLRTVLVSLR